MSDFNIWIIIFLAIHVVYHIVAAFGVIKSLIHQHLTHKKWSTPLVGIISVIWIILSIGLLVGALMEHSTLSCH